MKVMCAISKPPLSNWLPHPTSSNIALVFAIQLEVEALSNVVHIRAMGLFDLQAHLVPTMAIIMIIEGSKTPQAILIRAQRRYQPKCLFCEQLGHIAKNCL